MSSPAFVLIPSFLIALGYHLSAGYTPAGGAFTWPEVTEHHRLFERLAHQIPREAALATTSSLHPHLSHRRYLYRYPTVGNAEYVLLDVSESTRGNPIDFRTAYDRLLASGFGVLDAVDGYILLQRGRAGQVNLPPAFYSYFLARGQPQVRGQADFGGVLRLLGYDLLNDPHGRLYVRLYWQRLKPLDRNYNLVPFLLSPSGEPLGEDLPPLTLLFWYPTSAWQAQDIVVAETLPVEAGPRARIAVGVTTGEEWDQTEARLPVQVDSASSWQAHPERHYVELGGAKKERRWYTRD